MFERIKNWFEGEPKAEKAENGEAPRDYIIIQQKRSGGEVITKKRYDKK